MLNVDVLRTFCFRQVNYLDQGLSVDHKALMLCSMFLIDMVYFERRGEGGGGS